MNKLVGLFILLFLMVTVIQAQDYLFINNNDGTSHAFKVGDIDSISFAKPEGYTIKMVSADTMKITYPGEVDLINAGSYGAANAVYHKDLTGISNFRVVFDFKINLNCNEGNSNVTICQLSGADKKMNIMAFL